MIFNSMGQKPEKLKAVSYAGFASPRKEWTPETETLRTFDGQQGFTLAQGQ
jgi:hypothetical protein